MPGFFHVRECLRSTFCSCRGGEGEVFTHALHVATERIRICMSGYGLVGRALTVTAFLLRWLHLYCTGIGLGRSSVAHLSPLLFYKGCSSHPPPPLTLTFFCSAQMHRLVQLQPERHNAGGSPVRCGRMSDLHPRVRIYRRRPA